MCKRGHASRVDEFMIITKMTGACEEGPSYWKPMRAVTAVRLFRTVVNKEAKGKIDIYNEDHCKQNIGKV